MKRMPILSKVISLATLFFVLVGCQFNARPQGVPEEVQPFMEPFIKTFKSTFEAMGATDDYDYAFILKINRFGSVTYEGSLSEISHEVEITVFGNDELLGGIGDGVMEVDALIGEECPIHCESPIEYAVSGMVTSPPDCIFNMTVHYVSDEVMTCYTPCVPEVEYELPAGASLGGGFTLDPRGELDALGLSVDQLIEGVIRPSVTGNIQWSTQYQMFDLTGSDRIGCNLEGP